MIRLLEPRACPRPLQFERALTKDRSVDGRHADGQPLDHQDEGNDLNLVPNRSQPMAIVNAMTNSFGFGGTNASLIFAKP